MNDVETDVTKSYPIFRYFAFAHLPEKLQAISRPFAELAAQIAKVNPQGHPETAAALRKLLEAKDCAVRAALALVVCLLLTGCSINGKPVVPGLPPVSIPVECVGITDPVQLATCILEHALLGVPPAPIPTTSTPTVAPTAPAPAASPTSTSVPAPSPTSAPSVAAVPHFYGMNGCHAGDPNSVGADGVCGFTAIFSCAACTLHQAWPCDRAHEHWLGPDGALSGTCPADQNQEDAKNCNSCGGRQWDIPCSSIGSNFIQTLSGDVHLVPGGSCGTCYCGTLVGHGTYRVHVPAGAKACKDQNDYGDPATYAPGGGCAHGDVVLVDHEWNSATFTR